MDSVDIGLIVSGFMLAMVVLGVRVAFAAAIAGLTGLVWIFWSKRGYDPEHFFWALTVATPVTHQPRHPLAKATGDCCPAAEHIPSSSSPRGLTRPLW